MIVANTVQEIMDRAPVTERAGDTLLDAARQMRDADVGAVVVVDDGSRVTGVVTDRDITVRGVAEGLDPRTAKLSDVVTHDVVAVSPGDGLDTAAELMRVHG